MEIIKEFREFATRGNVVDLAVGIIIGGAFQKIVSSTVNDILMPPIGFVIGGVKFTDLKLTLGSLMEGMPPVTLNYGNFIQTVFDFTLLAVVIFMLIKGMNRLKARMEKKALKEEELADQPGREEQLLMEIRDLLKNRP